MHNDEETPHLHLIFLPVVHKKDKNGNNIDKLACSEFWKEKDSYRRLHNAFYNYYCQYKNVQFKQNIFVQNCTFLFSLFCTILFCPIKYHWVISTKSFVL